MLGEKLDKLHELRNRIEQINETLKELKKERDALQYKIIAEMKDTGIETVSAAGITVTRSQELVPTVVDKIAFVKWCVQNDYIEAMIQSRCNSAPFREYVEQHSCYPEGLEGYVRDKLSVRRR